MVAETYFGLLGPLQVHVGGIALPVLPGKQRVLLAALLLRANRLVSLDDLVDAMWGSEPPSSARVTLRNYVKELRKILGNTADTSICTVPGGYQIQLDIAYLDVCVFEALWDSAQASSRDGTWGLAAGQLSTALSLWRGEPLADIPSEWLAMREGSRLAEMRLHALELRIEADLRLGRPAAVIAELRQLTVVNPWRERLYALLMLALCQDGQQADALAVYGHARQGLLAELGVEPGPELRRLQHLILTGEAALLAPAVPFPSVAADRDAAGHAPSEPGSRALELVPRQLPPPVLYFTGRAAELAVLSTGPDTASEPTVLIYAIAGTAGVGKTALAVQWAHRVAAQFPDGQLFVNLRGYDPARPMTAGAALTGFLHGLGVAGQDIPASVQERAASYRSLLAGRRMLVLLDNAMSAEQVRPLLPGAPGCAAVVTSRDALAGLVARDGVRRLELDLLPLGDAVRLLRALIGARAEADPVAAQDLAICCSRLPLALRIAAELAAARPAMSLAELTGDLADQQRRLDLLDAGGDPRAALRAVFSWSGRHLEAAAFGAWRLLGLNPGAYFDCYAAAALTGATIERADQLLGLLSRAYLIQPAGQGRYSMHDLLRAYAAEQAMRDDAVPDLQAALTRLFDHYLHTAAVAMDAVYPAERHRRPRLSPSAIPVPPVHGNVAAARDWLDTRLDTLVAVVERAASIGLPAHATQLASTLFRYLDNSGYFAEGAAVHSQALRAARQAGDSAAEATALNNLGIAEMRLGRRQQGDSHLQEALDLFLGIGDRIGQARALISLGNADLQRGRYQQSTQRQKDALAICQDIGDEYGQITTLNNLGVLGLRMGRYQEASDHLERSLTLCHQTGNQIGEAYALDTLGVVCLRLGRCQQASDHLERSLALFGQAGALNPQAYALSDLGTIGVRMGRYQQAGENLERSLAMFRQAGDRTGEASALTGLGDLLLATDDTGGARRHYSAALRVADQLGDRYRLAGAHRGLGRIGAATGKIAHARQHWQQALSLYTELGAPEASRLRIELAEAELA